MADNLENIGFSYHANVGEDASPSAVAIRESANIALKGIIRATIVSSIGEARDETRSGHLLHYEVVEHFVSGADPETAKRIGDGVTAGVNLINGYFEQLTEVRKASIPLPVFSRTLEEVIPEQL